MTQTVQQGVEQFTRAGKLARVARFRRRHRTWIGYLFILPWLISLIWFDVIPFLLNGYLSLTDYSVGATLPQWVGLDNYREMFADDRFFLSLSNTLYYLVFAVPLGIIFAFVIALLLNANIRGQGTYRTIFYVPSVVPIVATAVIFGGLFNTSYGILNQILGLVGIEPVHWLSSPQWIKPSMIIMSLWSFGTMMIIFLAGLQGIPEGLYEAAEIDGARSTHKLIYITVPLMTPTIFFNLIIGLIAGFQIFTSAFVLIGTDGGPLNAGLFYMVYVYNNAFRYFRMGYSAAMSVVLFLIIFVLTLLMVQTSNRWVYYGDE